jgi:hypothetical protein
VINHNLLLIAGKSATGKSASLRSLREPEGVMFLGCEAGKDLPFPNKFQKYNIVDPYQVYEAFEHAEKMDVHTVVIDSLDFLMAMFESVHVIPSSDGRKAWQAYGEYFRNLLQKYVAGSSKNVIMTAHTYDIYNEKEMVMETLIKIKGSVMSQGVEAYFTQALASKVMPVKDLAEYNNPLLVITDDDEILGLKYCFQTKLTKETTGERIRSPLGLWDRQHTYVDNDVQKVLDRTHAYYNPSSQKEES